MRVAIGLLLILSVGLWKCLGLKNVHASIQIHIQTHIMLEKTQAFLSHPACLSGLHLVERKHPAIHYTRSVISQRTV